MGAAAAASARARHHRHGDAASEVNRSPARSTASTISASRCATRPATIIPSRAKATIPKVEIHDPLQAHTDLLGKYTDADIHNVTAYLVTLK